MTDEEFEKASQAYFHRSSNVSVEKMIEAAALCFPAANEVGKTMERGVIDYTLPVALRALAFAIEELTLNQQVLDERLRQLEHR